MPFEPHRLCFVLFMKTSGTVVGVERIKKILKAQLKHKFGAVEYELKVPDNRQCERRKYSGRHPEVRRRTFLIKCCRWRHSTLASHSHEKDYDSPNFSATWCVNSVINYFFDPLPQRKANRKAFRNRSDSMSAPSFNTSAHCNATPRAHGTVGVRRRSEREKSVRHGKWATV